MEVLLIILCLVFVAALIPPHLDPAIRLKEWTERRREK